MSRRIVVVAHFPPPVHGMAAAVERLCAVLEGLTPVRRVTIAAPGLERSGRYHLVRVGRVLRALGVLGAERRRSRTAFFSCDAGIGMLYTLVLTTWARVLGYRSYLQHHSYAYVDRRSAVLALLVRATGDGCVHLVSCEQMRTDLAARYPAARIRVVGVAAGIEAGDRGRTAATTRLAVGFLGNVCVEKGLDLAVETARAARRSGVPVDLLVAGPVVDAEADRILDRADREPDVSVTRLGPVYGAERDRFLDGLDVLLFPSRYAHESFGLVVWEAMARGVPVLAHRSGCLTARSVGDAGVVVERDEDFVAAAAAALERWWRAPEDRTAAGTTARGRALATIRASERATERLCRELAGLSVGGT